MSGLGKLFVLMGAGLIVVGGLLMLAGRWNLPLGKLPGDVVYRGERTTVYFPIVTSILLSIIVSLALWFVNRR